MRQQQAVDLEYEPEWVARPRPRRAPGGPPVTFLLLVLSAPFLGWASLPLAGFDGHHYAAMLVALTQYAIPVGAVLTMLTLVLRRWLTSLLVGLVTVLLIVLVAPRAIPDPWPPPQGAELRVMSLNMHFGDADSERAVSLLRQRRVDVLSLQEVTPDGLDRLDRAGLSDLLPYRVMQERPGAEGSGLVSRFPLRPLDLVPETTMRQPSALVDLPGARDVEMVAVHPVIPVEAALNERWEAELAALPDPARGSATPRVLVGDFNATLDHAPMRGLLGRGYQDAAEVTGKGLEPTWPAPGEYVPPPVTIDHVLFSGGLGVRGFEAFEVSGADHRAVYAHLVVPR